MAPKYEENDRLLVDREELARLCATAESTVRNWLRQGIIERANPAAPLGEEALFDLAVCLPRILSYVDEKRELTLARHGDAGPPSRVVIQALSEKFGCSPSAIRADLKLISGSRNGDPQIATPCTAERQSQSTLRKVGLSQEQWRELRLEAKELGVPMEALAQVIIADFIRRKRRQRKM